MSSTSDAKYAHTLLSFYDKLYTEKYGNKPKYNKYREKWAMQDVVDSVGFERAKELLEYYLKVTKPRHPLQWFFYNFDKLDDMLEQKQADAVRRKKMLEETKRMVEENEHRSISN
jgi:hypothetical protein